MRGTKLINKTLIHYGTTKYKLPNRPEGLFYPPALYGLFTYCTSYQTGQTDLHSQALLWLAAQATKQAKQVSFDTFTTCSIAKHQIGQTDFHLLTLDGSTICNQIELGGDQNLGRRLIYTPHLICKHYSDSSFKAIWGQSPVGMMMIRLTRIVWCQCNGIDQRKICSGGKKGWGMKLTSHV